MFGKSIIKSIRKFIEGTIKYFDACKTEKSVLKCSYFLMKCVNVILQNTFSPSHSRPFTRSRSLMGTVPSFMDIVGESDGQQLRRGNFSSSSIAREGDIRKQFLHSFFLAWLGPNLLPKLNIILIINIFFPAKN